MYGIVRARTNITEHGSALSETLYRHLKKLHIPYFLVLHRSRKEMSSPRRVKQTIHHQSTTKTKDTIFRIIFGMHWVIAECDWFDWDNRIQVAHRREGPEL